MSDLTPPAGLGEHGLAAWGRAYRELRILYREVRPFEDALASYARAEQLRESVERVWIGNGRQLTTVFPNGAVATAPDFKLLTDAEEAVARRLAALGLVPVKAPKRDAGGRPVGANSAPDRLPLPASPVVALREAGRLRPALPAGRDEGREEG